MKQDVSSVAVSFPPGMMSTARAPVAMGTGYAREIINMLAGPNGAGVKRCGVTPYGPSLAGKTFAALFGYQTPAGVMQVLGVTTTGEVYLLASGVWSLLKSGLDPAGVPRGVVFGGKLILCNGMDDLLMWDGASLLPVEEMVVEKSSPTYLSSTTFQVDSEASFYQVGRVVQATLSAGVVSSTITAVVASGVHVLVTLASGILDSTLSKVAYAARPPRFAALYAAHDRLWGFGRGPLTGSSLSVDADRSRVFYTVSVNDPTAWHDADGLTGYINLADKASGQDEVLAMSVRDGLTVFVLREALQVWGGSDPTAEGDFSWQKTLPVGAVHGGLVLELPNDLAFVTRYGMRTLGKVVQGEDLVVSDVGTEVDPTLAGLVAAALADSAVYRAICTAKCAWQGWLGLKMAGRFLAFQKGAAGFGWSEFTGIFCDASAFGALPNGKLLLAAGGQLYEYKDGVFADNGAQIFTRWWTPWLPPAKGKRWANQYVEVLTDVGLPIPLTLRRYRDLDARGDTLLTASAAAPADVWDEAMWDLAQWDNNAKPASLVRDHFVATSVALAVESSSTQGPLTVFGLKLYGVSER